MRHWRPTWIAGCVVICALRLTVCANGQITKLPHADTTGGNYFGTSVALDKHQAIVGASGEDSCGIGGGAAYIFAFTDSTGLWTPSARLTPSDCEPGLAFGRKVAINDRTALVAASQEYFGDVRPNAVYVFEKQAPGQWIQTARLTSSSNLSREMNAGAAVAIQGDQILFTTAGDPTPENQRDGAAYLYEKKEDRWRLTHQLIGSGTVQRGIFGGNAVLDANVLAVASSSYFSGRSGSVYIFESDLEGSWAEVARLGGIKDFYISLDLHKNNLIIGQAKSGPAESGIATLFARDSTGSWINTATLEPPTPYRKGAFGTEVALYGDRALVVGYDEQLRLNYNVDRVVYIYARRNGRWHYQGILDIGEAAFGSSIDLYGTTALIGVADAEAPGKAYIIKIP